MDDEDPIVWATRTRRKNALRVLVVGVVIMLAGGIWLATVLDFQVTRHYAMDNTKTSEMVVTQKIDPRLLSGAVAAIGSLLTIAGIVMLLRARPREVHADQA